MLHAFMCAHDSLLLNDRVTIAEQYGERKGPAEEVHDVTVQAMSAAWMRRFVDFQQPLAVDAGIDLRGRKRGGAEQFLDRAQIAAAAQKMRGKGMPQRMRRRA